MAEKNYSFGEKSVKRIVRSVRSFEQVNGLDGVDVERPAPELPRLESRGQYQWMFPQMVSQNQRGWGFWRAHALVQNP